jgi:hypothetical protein
MPKDKIIIEKRDELKSYGQLVQLGENEWYTGCWYYNGFFDKRKNRQDILRAAARAKAELVLCEDHIDEHGGHFEVGFYRMSGKAGSESAESN